MHSWRSLTRTGAAGFWVVWGPVGGSERRSERIFIELFPSKMLAMLKGQGKSKHRGADIKIICLRHTCSFWHTWSLNLSNDAFCSNFQIFSLFLDYFLPTQKAFRSASLWSRWKLAGQMFPGSSYITVCFLHGRLRPWLTREALQGQRSARRTAAPSAACSANPPVQKRRVRTEGNKRGKGVNGCRDAGEKMFGMMAINVYSTSKNHCKKTDRA